MGNCLNRRRLSFEKVEHQQDDVELFDSLDKIYGPYTYPDGHIIKFYSDLALWHLDIKHFIEHEIIDIDEPSALPSDILLIVLEYIYDDIQAILQCPNLWIIHTASTESESLDPWYKDISNSVTIPTRYKYLCDTNIVFGQLIDEIFFDIIMPDNIPCNYRKYLFDQIVVYEPGGYFNTHVDTVCDEYNYTLLLIPPMEYEGGEFIIEDKVIKSTPTLWQSILFHKDIKHSFNEVKSGHKIVFKVHMSFENMGGFGWDLDLPMAVALYEPISDGTESPVAPTANIASVDKDHDSLQDPYARLFLLHSRRLCL